MNETDITAYLAGTNGVSPLAGEVLPPVAVAAVAGGVSHDAADQVGRLSQWMPRRMSADAEILPEKYMLDARSGDMVKNDAFVASAAATWKDSIVGAQYMLNARPNSLILFGKTDELWETEFQEEVEAKFMLWAESPKNWLDSGGRNNFTAQIRLAVGSFIAGGEVVEIAEWKRKGYGPYRTAVRAIDADRLSDPLDRGFNFNRRLRNGVQLDDSDRVVGYWIRNRHPSEGPFVNYTMLTDSQWTFIPANRPWGRDNVNHVYEMTRPDQNRGISTMVSALSEMRMFQAFTRTQLQKAVIAATYATSIETELPDDIVGALGGGAAQSDNPTVAWMTDYLSAVDDFSGGSRNLHMGGAMIPVLPPGSTLKLQNPGAMGPDDDAYASMILRRIAASFDMGYEQLSRDYTKTNYSSARAALGETWKALQTKKRMVADRCANFRYRLWLEEIINDNGLDVLKRKHVPAFYDGLNGEAYCAADWIGAGRGTIDPLKEIQADVIAVANGLDTAENSIARRLGGDWRVVARQRARERAFDLSLGLTSIHDKNTQDQQNALSGSPQDKSA